MFLAEASGGADKSRVLERGNHRALTEEANKIRAVQLVSFFVVRAAATDNNVSECVRVSIGVHQRADSYDELPSNRGSGYGADCGAVQLLLDVLLREDVQVLVQHDGQEQLLESQGGLLNVPRLRLLLRDLPHRPVLVPVRPIRHCQHYILD